jgi:putative ABC transport system permease protein
VALAGVVLGVIVSAALAGVLDSLLFDVSPLHVPTYAMTAGLMLGVALVASYVPARRASSVDPMRALRAD